MSVGLARSHLVPSHIHLSLKSTVRQCLYYILRNLAILSKHICFSSVSPRILLIYQKIHVKH